ncbi:MAG: hypothetical protein RIG27_19005 [Coleofasciculus sp. F4-SAH-05]
MPIRTPFNYVVVEVGGNLTAEGDNHPFAAIGGLALFKVGDDIMGDGGKTLARPDNRFNLGLFGFGFLGGVEVLNRP